MRLIECYIEGFGKLSECKYSSSDGLNTIKQDNGYGKTTLTVFIKAMLYGLDDTRRASLDSNDRKHYLPWSGGRCGGSLTFESGGKKYRIERSFGNKASEDIFALYDLTTGKPSADFSASAGEELFGIDQDGFLRTVFLSEANLSGKNENKSISAKLSDLVGCDGDIGAMDEAVELLEKQRKIYRKRGGAGEIGDIKRRASELDLKIRELEEKEAEFLHAEGELSAVNDTLRELYKRRSEFEEKNRRLNDERLKKNFERQYLEMESAVKDEEAVLAGLSDFFKSGLPTQSEIERVREMDSASRITLSEKRSDVGDELTELADFFKSGVTEEDIAHASELSSLEGRMRADAQRADKEAKERRDALNELPTASPAELDSLTQEVISSKNANKSWRILIPVGILTAVLIIGIFFIIIGVRGYRAEKNALSLDSAKKRAAAALGDESILEIQTQDALIERLYLARVNAAKADELKEQARLLTESADALTEKADAALREIYEFISRFPRTETRTPADAVSTIARRYAVYKALSESRAAADKRREEQILLARDMASRVLEFTSRFPTVSDRPLDEVSAKLIEYNAASRSLLKMRESLAEFAREHKIDTDALTGDTATQVGEPCDTEALSEEILDFERKRTLLERMLNALADELEAKDELTSEKEMLLARADEYESKLAVILKTMEFLEDAKNSLTSRYLSRTKTAFDKYVSLIGLESGEDFTMDTSFTVMKSERGALRHTEAYSRGTRELYALSARLALVDSLYEKEAPPLILDDPFAYFDDEKLERALSVLKAVAKEKQVIYLTCSESRKI